MEGLLDDLEILIDYRNEYMTDEIMPETMSNDNNNNNNTNNNNNNNNGGTLPYQQNTKIQQTFETSDDNSNNMEKINENININSNNNNNMNKNIKKNQISMNVFVIDLIVFIAYSILHSVLLYVQLITLNVAINSPTNTLVTLLVSNNFIELKQSAFKKFQLETAFQVIMYQLSLCHIFYALVLFCVLRVATCNMQHAKRKKMFEVL